MTTPSAKIKPDLGLHRVQQGMSSEVAQYFYGVTITDIDFISPGLHSVMFDFPEAGTTYAISFDFDDEVAKSIFAKLPPHDYRQFIESLRRRTFPFRATLPTPVELDSIESYLGEIQQGQHDSFVPFVIKSIETHDQPASSDERVFQFDLSAEIDRYFDDSSLPRGAEPRIVILMGGPAAGKTTIRKQRYSTGHVLVDAADIFLSLSRGEYFDFPGPFDEILAVIGPLIARRAVSERRHIVTELIGSEFEPTKALIEAMGAIGYQVEMQAITCDIEEAQRRNMNRGDDNVSAYYAEHYQRTWLHDAATAALNQE